MSKLLYILLTLCSLALLSACQKRNDVLAMVGSECLTVEEFLKEVKEAPDYYVDFFQTVSGRKQFIEVLIKEKIMIAAAKELNLDKKSEYKKSIKEFKKDCCRQLEDYKRNLLIEKYHQKIKSDEIFVSESEAEKFYRENRDGYANPVNIKLKRILLPSLAEAQEVFRRLKKGEGFSKLAEEHPADFWADSQSDELEYSGPGSLGPEIEKTALFLKIGQISEPVETKTGFFILKKISEAPGRPVSMEEAEPLIMEVLEKKKFDMLLEELKKKYPVKVDRDLIDKYFRQSAIDGVGAKK